MASLIITLNGLPEKLILQPVQSVPLPQNYRFTVGWNAGWYPPRRDTLTLFVRNPAGGYALIGWISSQEEAGTMGFNMLLQQLLTYAKFSNRWGETVECMVAATATNGNTFVAVSNLQPLRLPVRPLPDLPMNQYTWVALCADTMPPVSMPFPSGRRLYRREPTGSGAALTLPRLFYVRPDNTLEDTNASRGFDRLTFWQAVFGMSIKETTNLKFEAVMAKLLNAHTIATAPASAKLADLQTALSSSFGGFSRCLMWTPTRFVCMQHQGPNTLFAIEFDALGLHSAYQPNWLAAEDKSVVWNYRRMNYPTPPPSSGILSLG